ncbi:DUF4743 domain-containing protein [Mitsuaria sp. WAJ17]|uniref:NUDIX hydrolase n=1 Tax=Mitsuaria sp. WAJ17 TaxID=2761452 RepID=UPI0016039BA7|nr:DUF4743 domain-containing protein [Mitsuaria sp. WAJ17]MBB2487429.1 DUF4743 domain-containing protein [Mitsuaria sp. WAJ17]
MQAAAASTVGPARPPDDWWRLSLDGQALGWLAPAHQGLLADWGLGEALAGSHTWSVRSGAGDAAARTAWLADLAQRLREAGWVRGWRGERYRCQLPGPGGIGQPADGPVFFELERAAYRFFGLSSQAVHINGVDAAGALWCGRRALHKATDPGRLDNLAAGGLPAGEALFECARRELWEEAGVPATLCGSLRLMGCLRTARVEPEGWHDEWLHVFELALPAGFTPRNQDGEVSTFECLAPAEVAQRIDLQDFSPDAAVASAWWLRSRGGG